MGEEFEKQRCETADYGIALLKYLGLPARMHQQDYMRKNWVNIYKANEWDVIETVVDFFGSIFPMMETSERRVYTGEFRNKRHIIEDRIEKMEIREKYESRVLDKLLIGQGD